MSAMCTLSTVYYMSTHALKTAACTLSNTNNHTLLMLLVQSQKNHICRAFEVLYDCQIAYDRFNAVIFVFVQLIKSLKIYDRLFTSLFLKIQVEQ